MKHVKLFENFNWELLSDSGSEALVYTDGEYAYRVIENSSKGDYDYYFKKIQHIIGKDLKHVVKVFDYRYNEQDKKAILVMEILQPIDVSKFDKSEYDWASDELNHAQDEVSNATYIASKINDPELRKAVQSIYLAGHELGWDHMDIGFHNLMFDPKTNNYKQIDLL